MSDPRHDSTIHRTGNASTAKGVCLILAAIAVTASRASFPIEQPSPHTDSEAVASGPSARWLGPDGEPLPFQKDSQALDFLRDATVVAEVRLSQGINRPVKVLLERDGVRAHAIFRVIDMKVRQGPTAAAYHMLRDSYAFEVAAYELSRLLGLDNVPPTVPRRLKGRNGSLQLWIEEARTEAARIESGEQPAKLALWTFQRQNMLLFDNLIFNFDRNLGNQLVDPTGKLWFVDHTRSFKSVGMLQSAQSVRFCERDLWRRLRELDPKLVRERLRPHLDGDAIAAILTRRKKLIKRIEELIAEQGEERVLFDL